MSALLDSNNKLKLGIFSANCSSGQAMTRIEERWDSSWDNNLEQAQLSDEAGLEFQLPIARWIGYGGATNFQHNVLETLTWAAGLLAQTKNITIFPYSMPAVRRKVRRLPPAMPTTCSHQ